MLAVEGTESKGEMKWVADVLIWISKRVKKKKDTLSNLRFRYLRAIGFSVTAVRGDRAFGALPEKRVPFDREIFPLRIFSLSFIYSRAICGHATPLIFA